MTLPREVQDAVDAGDETYGLYASGISGHRHWQAIRAHLMSQEAEIERLRESTHYANGVADLAMKHRDVAESRLAATNALLRDIADCAWFARTAPATVELIQAHLQGTGDE